ncbi:MAG: efflux RND transporter periplasmic adaptor subunit [Muribaculaceae bacterium]|nr:efflux RND transporter periplasmic adaptor subunit [Muribaculaceae bacterium]
MLKTSGMALCGCLAVALAACGGDKNSDQMAAMAGQQAPQLATITAAPSSVTLDVKFPTTLQGKTDIEVRPQVSGTIQTVNIDEGAVVRKGQVLFTLDPVPFQAAVNQAKAAVDAAKVNVDNNKLTEAQNKLLLDKNIISDYVYQQAANALSAANAQLAQAQAALVSAQKNLSYCTISAPSDGVVGQIPFRQGSYVSPQNALTTVSDNSEVYAYFSFTEKDLLEMTKNGTLSQAQIIASLPAARLQLSDGQMYGVEGKVTTISGVVNPSTGASSARAIFNNPSGLLRSGLTGTLILPQNFADRIVIPQKATYELQNLRYVFKVESVNDTLKAVQYPIEVERLNDGKNFVVVSGIEPGDKIITEGIGIGGKVKNNMPVTPVEAQPEAAAPAAGESK